MILTDLEIADLVHENYLIIDPWLPENVQAASVDLTLDGKLLRFSDEIEVTRPWEPQKLWREVESGKELLLGPGEFALGTTREYLNLPNNLSAEVWGKSSLGRCGLSIHVTAGFVDPGFRGNITLEFFNVSPVPIALREGMPICQVVFSQTKGRAQYGGRYQGQRGITPSLYHIGKTSDG